MLESSAEVVFFVARPNVGEFTQIGLLMWDVYNTRTTFAKPSRQGSFSRGHWQVCLELSEMLSQEVFCESNVTARCNDCVPKGLKCLYVWRGNAPRRSGPRLRRHRESLPSTCPTFTIISRIWHSCTTYVSDVYEILIPVPVLARTLSCICNTT